MTTTNASAISPAEPATARSPKGLWLAIGALAVAVAALGGVLIGQHRGDAVDGKAPVASAALATPTTTATATATPAPNDGVPPPAPSVASTTPPAPVPIPAPVRAPESAPAVQPTPTPTPTPAAAAAAAAAPVPAPAVKPCAVCGRVETVRTVQREQPTTGVGAVAGGVVGGVLGNQIGHGNGRAVATVAGAVGGGYLGNTIEKRTRTVTRYQVAVRMQNGSLRTVETATAPPIGKPVTLKNGVLRPADGKA